CFLPPSGYRRLRRDRENGLSGTARGSAARVRTDPPSRGGAVLVRRGERQQRRVRSRMLFPLLVTIPPGSSIPLIWSGSMSSLRVLCVPGVLRGHLLGRVSRMGGPLTRGRAGWSGATHATAPWPGLRAACRAGAAGLYWKCRCEGLEGGKG